MKSSLSRSAHSARPYLWPLIGLNATVTGVVAGLTIIDALLFSSCLCFLASFGFILNDIVDREIDIDAHPDRLADIDIAGLRLAHVTMWLLLLFGMAISYFSGGNAPIVAIGIAISLASYSLVFRKQLLIATIVSATSITSPLWAPFIVVGTSIPMFHLVIVCVAFILVAARETILDMIDLHADLRGRRETIATVMGEQISIVVACVLTVTGFITLSVACIFQILATPIIGTAVMVVSLGGFGWLTLGTTARIAFAKQQDTQTLDTYISRTRLAMVLVPVFIIVDWLSRG